MILIIGGVFQGKHDFAEKKLNIPSEKIFDGFHLKVKEHFLNGEDCGEFLDKIFKGGFEVIISDEVGSGIVPTDKNERAWREAVGRSLCTAAEKCSEVWRVCCGIGIRIK